MAAKTTTSAAEQFKTLSDREQADLKHDAWSRTIDRWTDDKPDVYERIESSSKTDWFDMELEIYQDDNGRDYFHIVTGVEYTPGHENGKRMYEIVHDLMDDYRKDLHKLIHGE